MTHPNPTPEPVQPEPADAENTTEDTKERNPTLLEQMGGPSGVLASVVPVVVFVAANGIGGLTVGIVAALASAVGIGIWRLVRREPLQPAVSGVLGVGLCAFIAYRTGEARGYFAYGIWFSLGAGIVSVVSVLVRWPIIGVLWAALNGHGQGWRDDRRARTAYTIATLVWATFFLARFGVQQWLYLENETGLLGAARLAMGLPLTAVALLLTIWLVRRAGRPQDVPARRRPT